MRENLRWAYVGSLERTEFLKFLHYPIRTLQARAQPCWQPTLTNMAGFPAALSSPPMSDIPRPTMRRKSSAQNLLSSFKPPASGPTPGGSISSATGAAYAAAVQTPTATVSPGREWDGQSVQSDSLSSTATLVANGTPAIAQGTSVEYLRDLVQKRIVTLTYMRNVHEGRSHWFHTIMMSRGELDRVFNNVAMKKRTNLFAILAMSLSNLLDIPQAHDYLRGLLNTMNEYDQAKEEPDKPKYVQDIHDISTTSKF
jgi:hypothetical protein